MKKEIASIYYVRFFAMLMVVLVHTTAQYAHLFDVPSISNTFYFFLNHIVRVEGGMFVMIMGIVFFYMYRDRPLTMETLWAYWKKRVVYILIPYVVWSLIYEVEMWYYQDRVLVFSEVVHRILFGESKYQLYFIFIVVQFYLIFPLLMVMVRKWGFFNKYLWLFGLLIEFAYFKFSMATHYVQVPFLLTKIGPYLLGAWIGMHYESILLKMTKTKLITSGLIGFALGLTYVFIRYRNTYFDRLALEVDYVKWIGILFMAIGSLFFFYFAEYLVKTSSEKSIHRMRSVANYSFGYYLMHPLVLLQVMLLIPTREMPFPWHITIFLQYVITIILCYFIIWTFHRFVPFAGFLFGKLPKKAPLVWQIKE